MASLKCEVWNSFVSLSAAWFPAHRYFYFQVINVFLVTTIAGSVIDSLYAIIDRPRSIFALLGKSLSSMGGFFLAYFVLKAFSGLGAELARLSSFTGSFLKENFTFHNTPRDREAVYLGLVRDIRNPGWFPYAKVLAQDTVLVVVAMTYACIAPMVLCGAIFYFALAYFVYKHQLLYIYEPIFETGGMFWPKLARRMVFGLLASQCVMIGMLILKEAYSKIYALLILMMLTYFYLKRLRSLYEPSAEQLPLDMATSLDLEKERGGVESCVELAGAGEYFQPSLRASTDLQPSLDFESDEYSPI